MEGKTVSATMAPSATALGLPLLIALAALGAAAMNLLLPVLPLLEETLGSHHHVVQSALTSFLVGSAVTQLALGPLSQRYSSNHLTLLALLAFCIGSAVAALAPGHAFLAVGRLLQGVGGAASLALAEAAAADASDDAVVVRRISYLNAGMAAAVLTAPLIGAAIGSAFGWRTICWSTFAVGIVLFVLCWRASAAAPSLRAADGARPAGFGLLRSRGFVGHSLCAGFVMVNYFSLAAFGPHIGVHLLGLSHQGYGLLFAALGVGYIAGNFASPWLCKRHGQQRATTGALSIGIAAGLLGTLLAATGNLSTTSFLAVGLVVAAVTGTVLPSAAAAALNREAASLGSAAGLLNFAIFGIGAMVIHLVGSHVGTSPAPVMAILPAASAVALFASFVACAPTSRAVMP